MGGVDGRKEHILLLLPVLFLLLSVRGPTDLWFVKTRSRCLSIFRYNVSGFWFLDAAVSFLLRHDNTPPMNEWLVYYLLIWRSTVFNLIIACSMSDGSFGPIQVPFLHLPTRCDNFWLVVQHYQIDHYC